MICDNCPASVLDGACEHCSERKPEVTAHAGMARATAGFMDAMDTLFLAKRHDRIAGERAGL